MKIGDRVRIDFEGVAGKPVWADDSSKYNKYNQVGGFIVARHQPHNYRDTAWWVRLDGATDTRARGGFPGITESDFCIDEKFLVEENNIVDRSQLLETYEV